VSEQRQELVETLKFFQARRKLITLTIFNFTCEMFEGNFQLPADCINESLHEMLADLTSLELESILSVITPDVPSEYIIEQYSVECKLSHVEVFKSIGPDNLPNWLLRDISRGWLNLSALY
jgi:hypothetical protein